VLAPRRGRLAPGGNPADNGAVADSRHRLAPATPRQRRNARRASGQPSVCWFCGTIWREPDERANVRGMSGGDDPTPKEPEHKPDVLFLHSRNEAGDGFRVIRAREEGLQVGEIKPVKEGEPIKGDLVKLSPRKEAGGRLFDVHVMLSDKEVSHAAAARTRPGPAQVATEAYVRNWETIFGRGPKADVLPN
jgi:hypothetical protein